MMSLFTIGPLFNKIKDFTNENLSTTLLKDSAAPYNLQCRVNTILINHLSGI